MVQNRYEYLERLRIERLESLLEAAIQTEPEDCGYIDAILRTMAAKEKAHPTGRVSDIDEAWEEFQTCFHTEEGRGLSLYGAAPRPSQTTPPKRRATVRRLWQTALIAAVCLLASIAAAQAAGKDFLGALASWSDEVFSFGAVQPGTVDTPHISTDEENALQATGTGRVVRIRTAETVPYSSLQQPLDAYAVTEVSEPAKLPEGYTLDKIQALYREEPEYLSLSAKYVNGEEMISISVIQYHDVPSTQKQMNRSPFSKQTAHCSISSRISPTIPSHGSQSITNATSSRR